MAKETIKEPVVLKDTIKEPTKEIDSIQPGTILRLEVEHKFETGLSFEVAGFNGRFEPGRTIFIPDDVWKAVKREFGANVKLIKDPQTIE